MPADEIEVEEGAEEGLRLHNSRGPREILGENGRAAALRTVKCTAVFDGSGRFNPSFDETVVEDIPADSVIFAVGQTSDLSFLQPEDGVETARGLIKVNPETYQTSAPDVFACGDVAHGPRLFIDAIASAQVAARSMHDFLRGTRTEIAVRKKWSPALYTMADGWNTIGRVNPPAIESERRAASLEIIEERFPEAEARRQGARCLRCNVNTVFDTGMCVACNGCVDVCPQNILKLVGLSQLIEDPGWLSDASASFEVSEDELKAMPAADLDAMGGVMLKDEATCIRCAMCASRCPTHAVLMKRFDWYTECVSIQARNPKLRYAE
jgi:ferredoxin